MEKEMKMSGKTYQAPVMESVNVELQSILAGTGGVTECTCNIGVGFSGGGSGGGGARSRENNSWDED